MSTALDSEVSEDPDSSLPRARPPTRLFGAPTTSNRASDEALFTPEFTRLLAMQAAYGFSFSMFFLLPKYLAASGASPLQIGFVMGGFGVACILTIPFLQPLIQLLGKRGVLMGATLSLALAGVGFAVIEPVGIGAIFLRASEGITWTIMFSTATALTADMAPRARLAQAIGITGAAALVMNAVAPAIGEPLAERFGYRPVFLLAALAALVAAGMAFRLRIPESSRPEQLPAHDSLLPARSAPRQSLYVVFGFSGVGFSSMFTFLAPFALTQGVRVISTFFVTYTAAALAMRLFGGRLADELGHRTVASVGLVLYGVVLLSTGFLGAHHLVILGIGFGLTHGAVFPALMAHLINQTSAQRRPRVLGMANGAMSLGISTVFPLGFVVGHVGYLGMFAIVGTLVAGSAALLHADGGLAH